MKKKKKKRLYELDIHKRKKVLCNNAGNNKKGAPSFFYSHSSSSSSSPKGGGPKEEEERKQTHTHTVHGPAACLKRTTRSVIVSRPAAANRNARVSFFTLGQVQRRSPFSSLHLRRQSTVVIVLVLYVYSLHWFKCALHLFSSLRSAPVQTG